MIHFIWAIGLIWISFLVSEFTPQDTVEPPVQPVVIDDFESYPLGWITTRWKRTYKGDIIDITSDYNRDQEYFSVTEEGDQKFLRAFVDKAAHRILLPQGDDLEWNLKTHPRLQWDWRALHLPARADETRNNTNDTGAALYVTFSVDFFGRPRSIKYTYSTTQPVGTTATYGPLKVLVVASGEDEMNNWVRMERDVVADYKMLFGEDPPDKPLSIMLWSDADTMKDQAKADFDNLTLLPPKP